MKRFEPVCNEWTAMEDDPKGRYVEHREAALAVAAEREKWQVLNDQLMALRIENEKLKEQHWEKVHQWGQDREYHYYQSCQCARCRAYYELAAAEQKAHIERGELSWISTLPKP